jgi:predicted transcriptional regulator
MQHEVLLLSVRPTFVRRILEGTKTVELRRVRPNVAAGQQVLIYSSSPTMALLASAVVERLETASPASLWNHVAHAAGVSRSEYDSYFRDAERAVGLWLTDVSAFKRAIPLNELRKRWPSFRPPQSYCFVRATFEQPMRQLKGISPRATG